MAAVTNAAKYGCQQNVDGGRCGAAVLHMKNAIHCMVHFQQLYNLIIRKIGRYWCLNHDLNCLSEAPGYTPANLIQNVTPIGCPGGRYMGSGMFMLGYYCAACGLHRQTNAEEHAEIITKSQSMDRLKRKIEMVDSIPAKTSKQIVMLTEVEDAVVILEKRRKRLEDDEAEITQQLEKVVDCLV